MAKAGSVEIDLRANTARLRSDIGKAKRSIKGFSTSATKSFRAMRSSMSRMSAGFASLAAKIIAVAGPAAMGLLIKSSLATQDALGKTADKLGIAAQSLAGFRLAAELAGVEQKTLEKSVQNMVRTIGDASDGLDTYAKWYARLGLNIDELKKKDPEQQFYAVADSLKNLSSNTERVSAAYAIFGGRGTAVLNMLEQGTDAIKGYVTEASNLGVALSRIDIKQIENANDAMTRAKKATEGFGNQLALQLAPALEALANSYVENAGGLDAMEKTAKKMVGGMVSGIGFVMDAWRGLRVSIHGLTVLFAKAGEAIIGTVYRIAEGWRLLSNLIPGVNIAPLTTLNGVLVQAETNTKAMVAAMEKAVGEESPSVLLMKQWEAVKLAAEEAATAQIAAAAARREENSSGDGEGGTLTEKQMEAEIAAAEAHTAAMLVITTKAANDQLKLKTDTAKKSADVDRTMYQSAIGFMQRLAKDNKAVAYILIAVQAFKAAKDIQIQATAARAMVLAYGQVEAAAHSAMFNYGAAAAAVARSVSAAAAITATAALSTGFVLGSAALDASQVNETGTSASTEQPTTTTTSPINPVINEAAGTSTASSGSITINVNGVITDEIMQDLVIPAIQDAANDKDIILFSNDSRQAQELT